MANRNKMALKYAIAVRAAIVITGLLPLGAVARADSGEVTLTDASGLDYFINTNIDFATSSSASGAVSEASYSGPVSATTLSGGLVSSTLDDAFDGAYAVCVTFDTAARGPCNTGDTTYKFYNQLGPSEGLELGDRQVVLPQADMGSGLTLRRKVYVPADDTFIRWLTIFTNTSGTTLRFNVIMSNNLGSDSNTIISDSSLGGAPPTSIRDTRAQWVATMQRYSGTRSSDPRLGHVLQGPGALARINRLSFTNNDDNPYWSYGVVLEPGETGIIVSYATGQPTKAQAAAKAAELVGLPESALAGLDATQRARILNFNVFCPIAVSDCQEVRSDGAGGCNITPLTAVDCDDGNACTLVDRCVVGTCLGQDERSCPTPAGACVKGAACDPSLGCVTVYADVGARCDDGNPCTDSACDAGHVCVPENDDSNSCTDNNSCTDDRCEAGVCVSTPDNGNACSDGNPCTTDSCSAGSCTSIADNAAQCSDGNPCTADACSGGNCIGTPDIATNGTPCDDGVACTDDVCTGGACVGTPDATNACDDGNPCTDDACNSVGACVGRADDQNTCPDDVNPCTDAACRSGVCQQLSDDTNACDDGNACTTEVCRAGLCVSSNADGTACDDGRAYTTNDVCTRGICAGSSSSGNGPKDEADDDGGGCACNASGNGFASGAQLMALFLIGRLFKRRRRL